MLFQKKNPRKNRGCTRSAQVVVPSVPIRWEKIQNSSFFGFQIRCEINETTIKWFENQKRSNMLYPLANIVCCRGVAKVCFHVVARLKKGDLFSGAGAFSVRWPRLCTLTHPRWTNLTTPKGTNEVNKLSKPRTQNPVKGHKLSPKIVISGRWTKI